MFHIALCDDLPIERENLKSQLIELCDKAQVLPVFLEYSSGEELLQSCAESACTHELIFLDIYMGGISGIEAAKALRKNGNEVPIIFLTTSPDFAVESYNVDAVSYLIKPIVPARLQTVFNRFLQTYRPHSVFLQGKLFVVGDIVSAESRNKTVLLRFTNGATAEIQERLDIVEAALFGKNFLRCHQSFIVNLDYVLGIENGAFKTTVGTEVLIRKREFTQMRGKYFDYITSF